MYKCALEFDRMREILIMFYNLMLKIDIILSDRIELLILY